MNRFFITLPLAFLISVGCAQNVQLTTKDGREIISTINAVSSNTLYTKSGNFAFVDLNLAAFEKEDPANRSMYDKLTSAGITVKFTGTEPIYKPADVPTIGANPIYVNDVDINNLPAIKYIRLEYTELSAVNPLTTKNQKGNLRIDYGQDYGKWKDLFVRDQAGKIMQFNSQMDVVNFFYANGWVLFSNYTYSPMSGVFLTVSIMQKTH
jgi:hypothetical protein